LDFERACRAWREFCFVEEIRIRFRFGAAHRIHRRKEGT